LECWDGQNLCCHASWVCHDSGISQDKKLRKKLHFFSKAGFVLYPEWVNSNWSTWEQNDTHQMMMLPVMFAGCIMMVIMWQGTIMVIMYRRAKAKFGSERLEIHEYALYSR
jgi:hypothetical protein